MFVLVSYKKTLLVEELNFTTDPCLIYICFWKISVVAFLRGEVLHGFVHRSSKENVFFFLDLLIFKYDIVCIKC